MSSNQEKPKFVSSIPNNKLEPVFIGRPETDALTSCESNTEKKSSVYVPAFLRNKQEDQPVEKRVTKKPEQKKPQLTQNEFPDLLSSKKKSSEKKPEAKSVGNVTTGRVSYLEMLKKPKLEEVPTEIVEQQVAQRGMLVLGRGAPKQSAQTVSSWADDDTEPDYSEPFYPTQGCDYDEDEAEEEAVDADFYDTYYRRR